MSRRALLAAPLALGMTAHSETAAGSAHAPDAIRERIALVVETFIHMGENQPSGRTGTIESSVTGQ